MACRLVIAFAASASAFTGSRSALPSPVARAAHGAPEMVVKVGVIGAGRIGLVHLEALSQTQDAARAGAPRFGEVAAGRSGREVEGGWKRGTFCAAP